MTKRYTIREARADRDAECAKESRHPNEFPYVVSIWSQTGLYSGHRRYWGKFKTKAGAERIMEGWKVQLPKMYELGVET